MILMNLRYLHLFHHSHIWKWLSIDISNLFHINISIFFTFVSIIHHCLWTIPSTNIHHLLGHNMCLWRMYFVGSGSDSSSYKPFISYHTCSLLKSIELITIEWNLLSYTQIQSVTNFSFHSLLNSQYLFFTILTNSIYPFPFILFKIHI